MGFDPWPICFVRSKALEGEDGLEQFNEERFRGGAGSAKLCDGSPRRPFVIPLTGQQGLSLGLSYAYSILQG